MDTAINLAEKLALLEGPYRPGLIGYMNDYKLLVVKTQGEFVWHKHDETDDFFLVLKGRLTIQLRDRDVVLEPGELFVVPRGVEHCPEADGVPAEASRSVVQAAPRSAKPRQGRGSWRVGDPGFEPGTSSLSAF